MAVGIRRTYVVVERSPAQGGHRHERRAPGLDHLAFRAGSPAELDALVAGAPEHGWRLMFADRHPFAGGYEVELVAGQPRTAASTRAPAWATGTSSRSPVLRSRTSMTPPARPRPTVTIVGMPSSSASLNFTPGDTFGRSS